MNFFQMTYPFGNDQNPFGVAYGKKDSDLFILPATGKMVKDWSASMLEIREGIFSDYLANDMGLRLCSARLKQAIAHNLRPKDVVQWLAVDVCVPESKKVEEYFALHFPISFDVVDPIRSTMVGAFVVKPVFKSEVIRELSVFGLPNVRGRSMYVSEELKSKIVSLQVTGVAFEPLKHQ